MATHTLLIYILAAFGLSLTPGPNSLLVLTHGAIYGHRRTWLTVWGGALGFLLLIALSMAGIGALLKASANALIVLKLIGGAYLIWLGIQLWRSPPVMVAADAPAAQTSGSAMFRQGLLTAISNPKALLFYGAFLPQFVDATRDLLPQFILMATIFVAVEILVEWLLALLAHRIRPLLQRAGRKFNQIRGGMFMAMGVALPMTR